MVACRPGHGKAPIPAGTRFAAVPAGGPRPAPRNAGGEAAARPLPAAPKAVAACPALREESARRATRDPVAEPTLVVSRGPPVLPESVMATFVRSHLSLVALLAIALPAVGCGSTHAGASTPESASDAPAWVDKPQAAYDDEVTTAAIFAVGIAANNPNPSARRSMAISRGRSEIARTLQVVVQGMIEDYQSTNRDFFEGMDTASSTEMWSEVSRQITDEVLVGSRQVDAWRDPASNTEYVLMKLEFNDVIASYKDQMAASFKREATRERIKADKESMEARLDEQLKKLQEKTSAQLFQDFVEKMGG